VTPNRSRIDEWGKKGESLVACYHEPKRRRFIVEWYPTSGKPRRQTFPYAPGQQAQARREAKVFGAEMALSRGVIVHPDVPETTHAMYERFVKAMESAWRPATRTSNSYRWKLWEAFYKPQTEPNLVTEDILDDFLARLRVTKTSAYQIRQVFALLRAVYRLGVRRKWLVAAAPLTYELRLGKDEVANDPEEYHPSEWTALLNHIPDDVHGWRLRVAILLAGAQGARINSITHLRWSDVDAESNEIRWPAAFMKQGREFAQPMTPVAVEALNVAWRWRRQLGYTGDWVLPVVRFGTVDAPVKYQTLHTALVKAETRAGLTHKGLRAFHGLRRMAAENVYGQSNDMLMAAAWIGDRDVKQLRSYLKRRDERLDGAAKAAGETSSAMVHHTHNHTQESPSARKPSQDKSHWSELNRRPQQSEPPAKPTETGIYQGVDGSETHLSESRTAPESLVSPYPEPYPDPASTSDAEGSDRTSNPHLNSTTATVPNRAAGEASE
jgi:integrase